MLLKNAEYKTCSECGTRRQAKAETYGCDTCGTPIDFNNREMPRYEITHFFYDSSKEAIHYRFCTLTCAMKWAQAFVPTETDFYFITLPYISGWDELREFKSLLKPVADQQQSVAAVRGSSENPS